MFRRLVLLIVCLSLVGDVVSARAHDIFESPTAADVPKLIEALADPEVRQGASNALIQLGSDAVAPLTGALHSDSLEVRIWSAYTLGRLEATAQPAAAALLKQLSAEDSNERFVAACAVGRIGHVDHNTVTALTRILAEPELRLRRAAVEALGHGDAVAAEVLTQAFADPPLRAAVLASLERIGKPALPHLVAALGNDEIRLEVSEALRAIDLAAAREAGVAETTPADLNALKLSLENPRKDVEARIEAARRLGTLSAAGAEILVGAFGDDEQEVARAASAAFAEVGAAGLPALRQAMSHDLPQVRAAAADALAALGPRAQPAIADLATHLEDPDREVRRRVAAALDQLGEVADEATPALIQVVLNQREQEPTRQLAVKALSQIGPRVREPVIEAFQKAAKDNNYGVSQLAKQYLKELEGE